MIHSVLRNVEFYDHKCEMGLPSGFYLYGDRQKMYFFSHFTLGCPTIGLYIKGLEKLTTECDYQRIMYIYTNDEYTYYNTRVYIWRATNLIIKTFGFEYANPEM